MELPFPSALPQQAVAALAAYVRDRLDELRSMGPAPAGDAQPIREASVRQLTTVIVAATAPFAPNAYARARLLRQLHASGLLTQPACGAAGVAARRI